MSKIIPFKYKNEEDEACCQFCSLTDEFLTYIIESDSIEETREILRSLVEEACKLGMISLLEQQINNNAELMISLVNETNEYTQ